MSHSNRKKAQQLGMPYGTACGRLRKLVLFRLLQQLGETVCFRCGESIEVADDLSLEHKQPWLDVDSGLFWDLDNIAFSHLTCNSSARRRAPSTRVREDGKVRCGKCRRWASPVMFTANVSTPTGCSSWCKECRRTEGNWGHKGRISRKLS